MPMNANMSWLQQLFEQMGNGQDQSPLEPGNDWQDQLGQFLRMMGIGGDAGKKRSGSAGQLPGMPGGGGSAPFTPNFSLPPTQYQNTPNSVNLPAGYTGGVTFDAQGRATDDSGNPFPIGIGITSPVGTEPTDRAGLLRALQPSTIADPYGNMPGARGAQVSHIPDWTKPPLPGNMADPRNWNPTMWVNHPEWQNNDVWASYQRSLGAYDKRGPYTDPSGGSILPLLNGPTGTRLNAPSFDIHHPPAYGGSPTFSPGQFVNDWSRLGFHNRQDWRSAGKPRELQPGELWQQRMPGYSGPAYVNPYGGSNPSTGAGGAGGAGQLPTLPGSRPPSTGGTGSSVPLWQSLNYADKGAWKQANRPGINNL